MVRIMFFTGILFVIAANAIIGLYEPAVWWSMIVCGPLIIIGLRDCLQTRQAIRRNYPVLGNLRYLFEKIRPEINQYFIESNSDGAPFTRERRSMIYQRSKNALDTLPFGTQKDVYKVGYEWVNHSMLPSEVDYKELRVRIGSEACTRPYDCSIFNISAMSYGSLSNNAVMALNQGARAGDFAHNTGEGSITPYHQQGGDLIWQIGTGYFGCRTHDGVFDPELFKKNAAQDCVKMIEIKISQGAKPGHGGILPGSKVDEEVAQIRNVPVGKDVLSPPAHSRFSTPHELLDFIEELRTLSNGKPVGIKLCVGKRREFLALCKAMHKRGVVPDYICVDGAEGGTGAAPLEFSNHIGCPLSEGLIFVHNALVGIGMRDEVKIISAGKIASAFDIIKRLALGADICYSARAFMMSLGCIQALRCNHNDCPTGVATQKASLINGLVVSDKNKRVHNYHDATVESVAEMLGAMGLHSTENLRPWHIMRRVNSFTVHHYGEIYHYLKDGDLLSTDIPKDYRRAWESSSDEKFDFHGADLNTRKYHSKIRKAL